MRALYSAADERWIRRLPTRRQATPAGPCVQGLRVRLDLAPVLRQDETERDDGFDPWLCGWLLASDFHRRGRRHGGSERLPGFSGRHLPVVRQMRQPGLHAEADLARVQG